jgi:signal peptidase I
MRLLGRQRIVVIGIALFVMAVFPSYFRAFVIVGNSDAPGFATGDRVLVSLAAYDIRVPYSGHRVVRLADPRPGDMALIRLMDDRLAVKRIVAGPGTRIAMRDNHVTIDGVALEYVAVAPQEKAAITRGGLGPVVEIERGNGPETYISFGYGGSLGDFEEQVVPEGHYFVLGSNRDASMDSRQLGALRRERVLGKIIGRIGSAG